MKRENLQEIINSVMNDLSSNLHTLTIAKVTLVNDKTINCLPVINRVVDEKSIRLPEFIEVPPIFLQGGGSSLRMPIAVGDYALLIFCERSFDAWYNSQDFVSPVDLRMHDYSDAFAIVGVNPEKQMLSIPDVITQIGDTNQSGDYTHVGNRTQIGNFDLTGDYDQFGDFEITGNMEINGNLVVNGSISAQNFTGIDGGPMVSNVDIETTADVKAGAISLKTHTHGGVETGSGNTGAPQ